MRQPPDLQVEEIEGNKYPDRAAAQRAALPLLSSNLHTVIRDLLESGVLVNVDGKIIPAPENKIK